MKAKRMRLAKHAACIGKKRTSLIWLFRAVFGKWCVVISTEGSETG